MKILKLIISKYRFWILLLLFCSPAMIMAQDNKHSNLYVGGVYNYIFFNNSNYGVKFSNSLNSGLDAVYSIDYIDNRLGIGIRYFNQDYYYTDEPSNFNEYFYRQNYSIQQVCIPLIYERIFVIMKSFDISLVNSVILDYVIDYDATRFFTNRQEIHYSDIEFGKQLGISYCLGASISKEIFRRTNFVLTTLFGCNLRHSHEKLRLGFLDIPEDRFSFTTKIGIEYRIGNSSE